MRDEQQKLQATQKAGRKDDAKDLARDGQLHAASKQGHPKHDQDDAGDRRRTDDRPPEPDTPRPNR